MAGVMETEYQYRGRAIIIAIKNFINPKDKRNGSCRDLALMKDLFTLLDFEVKTYIDLTTEQIQEKLNKAKSWNKKYEPSCFVCLISTHGDEVYYGKSKTWNQSLYATDGGAIQVDDITSMFSDANCEAYRGKPKLFFIQACRTNSNKIHLRYDPGLCLYIQVQGVTGNSKNADSEKTVPKSDSADGLDKRSKNGNPEKTARDTIIDRQDTSDLSDGEWDGTLSDDEEEDSAGKGDASNALFRTDMSGQLISDDSKTMPGESCPPSVALTPLDCPQNCLIMFPVTSGRSAQRQYNGEGSWLLCFMHACRKHIVRNGKLLPFLTAVSDKVAIRDYAPMGTIEKTKNAATIVHRLTTDVTFEPMSENSMMAEWKQRWRIDT